MLYAYNPTGALFPATNIVSMDEPCLGLYELNYKTPDEHAWHRYQIIVVVREDKPTEFRRDMGDVSLFTHGQVRIPGAVWNELDRRYDVVHKVGELVDIADYLRGHPAFDKRELVGCNQIKG